MSGGRKEHILSSGADPFLQLFFTILLTSFFRLLSKCIGTFVPNKVVLASRHFPFSLLLTLVFSRTQKGVEQEKLLLLAWRGLLCDLNDSGRKHLATFLNCSFQVEALEAMSKSGAPSSAPINDRAASDRGGITPKPSAAATAKRTTTALKGDAILPPNNRPNPLVERPVERARAKGFKLAKTFKGHHMPVSK